MSVIRSKFREIADDEIRKEDRGRFVTKVFAISSVLIFFAGISIYAVVKDKFRDHNEYEQIDFSANLETSCSFNEENEQHISSLTSPLYIVGEVKVPGIYLTELPVYLYQLVDMAGGLTENADTQKINLAFLITENMMVIIPEKDSDSEKPGGGYTTIPYASDIRSFVDPESDEPFPVNINTADIRQLCMLPGIGSATAEDIIEYRTLNGPFKSIEDIMKVSGIKQSRFEKIKNKIKV